MAGMYEQTGDILIDDGKIVKVGQVGQVPEDCQVIDAAGRTVTPGLVDAHCHAGLWGTACREEMDGNEYTEPVLPGQMCIRDRPPSAHGSYPPHRQKSPQA